MRALLAVVLACGSASAFSLNIGGKKIDVGNALETAKDMKEAMDIGAEKEAELGGEVASNLIGKYGLDADKKLSDYVNLVGRTVARQGERDDVSYAFGVLDADFVGAYALPGGFIFVTRGLVKRLENEAQLAGVLAHEVAHVDAKHALKALRKTKVLAASGKAASRTMENKAVFDAAAGFLVGLAEKGFSRGDEHDADEKAPAMAAAAGYEGSGLWASLKKLYGEEKDDCAKRFSARHPALKDRLKRVEKLEAHGAEGASLADRFRKRAAIQ